MKNAVVSILMKRFNPCSSIGSQSMNSEERDFMFIGHINDVAKEDIPVEGIKGTKIQWLLGPKNDLPHFYMRLVTLEPGGVIPLHDHEIIHEMFIVKGKGAVLHEDGETPFEQGNFIYMPTMEIHGTKNTGDEDLQFICCINKAESPSYKK
ncbi:cupin domain-containing protein [candidate division KSB1 bacterium]